jgi:hypothetical protein
MTFEGHVENGQIVLHGDVPLAEGMRVRVELVAADLNDKAVVDPSTHQLPSLYERMKSFVGALKGLPSDYAINHDHYLHDQPKRQ